MSYQPGSVTLSLRPNPKSVSHPVWDRPALRRSSEQVEHHAGGDCDSCDRQRHRIGPSRPAGELQYSAPGLDASPKESGAAKAAKTATVTGTKEPGRNAPCPCGSGKKYKVCHGRPGHSL